MSRDLGFLSKSHYRLAANHLATTLGVNKSLMLSVLANFSVDVIPLAVIYEILLTISTWKIGAKNKGYQLLPDDLVVNTEGSDNEAESPRTQSQPTRAAKLRNYLQSSQWKFDLLAFSIPLGLFFALEARRTSAANSATHDLYYGTQEANAWHMPMPVLDTLKVALTLLSLRVLPNFDDTLDTYLNYDAFVKRWEDYKESHPEKEMGEAPNKPTLKKVIYASVLNSLSRLAAVLIPISTVYSAATASRMYDRVFETMQNLFGFKYPDIKFSDAIPDPQFNDSSTIWPIWLDGFYTNNWLERHTPRWLDTLESIISLVYYETGLHFGAGPTRFSSAQLQQMLLTQHVIGTPTIEERVTVGGHSTYVLEIPDPSNPHRPCTIAVDPVEDSASVFSRVGPLAINFGEIKQPIDAVLVTHNHADHNAASNKIAFRNPNVQVFMGKNSAAWTKSQKFKNPPVEMEWWQAKELKNVNGIHFATIHFVPSKHSSQSNSKDNNVVLWGSFIVEVIKPGAKNKFYYFVGDTALGKDMLDRQYRQQYLFAQIAERFPQIDLVLLPIGPGALEFKANHVDYWEAAQALRDLTSNGPGSAPPKTIPGHYYFWYGLENQIEQTLGNFLAVCRLQNISSYIYPLRAGASITLSDLENHTNEWKEEQEIDPEFYELPDLEVPMNGTAQWDDHLLFNNKPFSPLSLIVQPDGTLDLSPRFLADGDTVTSAAMRQTTPNSMSMVGNAALLLVAAHCANAVLPTAKSWFTTMSGWLFGKSTDNPSSAVKSSFSKAQEFWQQTPAPTSAAHAQTTVTSSSLQFN